MTFPQGRTIRKVIGGGEMQKKNHASQNAKVLLSEVMKN